ncbi:hypothetical protein MTO96_048088 [Rhipicephalus appendiculatus]
MKEQPEQAQPEPEEQEPQVKHQPLRGKMGAVGGPEQSAEVGPASTGKNAKGGSSKRSKARRRRLRLPSEEGTEGSGKKASLSASNVRLLEETAAVKRPRGVPGTRTGLQEEDRGANKDAAMAGRDVAEPAVAEAELRGGVLEPDQRVPFRKEGSQANVAASIPDDRGPKEGKLKSHRKSRKRHLKKATG